MFKSLLLSLVVLSSAALAQQPGGCTNDLVIDKFVVKRTRLVDGVERPFNPLGGFYASYNSTMSIFNSTRVGYLSMIPSTPKSGFTVKLNEESCFDMSRYRAVKFNVIAPANGSFWVALTQKSDNCTIHMEGSSI